VRSKPRIRCEAAAANCSWDCASACAAHALLRVGLPDLAGLPHQEHARFAANAFPTVALLVSIASSQVPVAASLTSMSAPLRGNDPAEIAEIVGAVERVLGRLVQAIVRDPTAWQPRTELIVRRRHWFEQRSVTTISSDSARSQAILLIHRSPEVISELVAAAGLNEQRRTLVVGRPGVDDAALAQAITQQLEGLCEKYFELRPNHRGVSRLLVQQIARDYGAFLTTTHSEVTAVMPISGLEGSVRSVPFSRSIELRQLSIVELKGLHVRHQEEFSLSRWFNRDSLGWKYCLAVRATRPGRQRPAVNYEDAGLAMTALRLVTDGAIGLSIAWIRPSAYTLIDVADRIVAMDDPGDTRGTPITHRQAREAANLYRRLSAQPPTDPFRIAVNRYNQAMTRSWTVDVLIDSWIALEAIYGGDESSSNQYRLSLRAARWLAATPPDRKQLLEGLKGSYGARNKVVHGSATVPKLRDHAMRARDAVRLSLMEWAIREGPNLKQIERDAEDGSLR
jgi:hypothetical protein